MKKILFIIASILITVGSIFAQNSKSNGALMFPFATEIEQPDGSKVTLKGNGDAVVNWLSTESGYSVIRSDKGWYEYASIQNEKLVASGIPVSTNEDTPNELSFFKANKTDLRYSESQVLASKSKYYTNTSKSSAKSFPTTGTQKVLLILASFSDKDSVLPSSTFDNVMNEVDYNGTGSFRDYYLASSYNQLDLTTTVTVWVKVPNTHAYYGANDASDNDTLPREFVRDAVNAAELAGVDFSEFDNDNDGYVDGVQVIHAGYGEEYGGADENNIWSHRWALGSSYAVTYDGVIINDYAIYPELRGTSGSNPSNIGVICHEFGHTLGLSDYYDTDYDESGGQSFDLGDWDLMAGGTWNNNGATPANHNAYSKSDLGWLTLTELNTPQNITLNNSMENAEAYKITTTTTDEFFVIENRQNIGFDANVPSHGMLIYHVDLNYSGWSSNDINCDPDHQGMDIEEADGTQESGSYEGDVFPGTSNKTEFTDLTTPGSLAWDGSSTSKPITQIVEDNGIITFKFMGGDDLETPSNFEASETSSSAIDLTWEKDSFDNDVLLAFSTSNVFGEPIDETTYSAGDNIVGGGIVLVSGDSTQFSHTELIANNSYYYQIWSYNGTSYSTEAIDSATTLCDGTATTPFSETFSSGTQPSCWTVIDSVGNGQVWSFNDASNFASTTGSTGFASVNSDSFGLGNTQNTTLVSPIFDFTNVNKVNLSFEYYYRDYISSDSAQLMISIDFGTSWQNIANWNDADFGTLNNPELFSMDVSSTVLGENGVIFAWNYTGENDYYFFLDDIAIQSYSDVSFQVVDSQDSSIQEASVTFNSIIETTDINGMVSFADVPSGDYTYEISKNGYLVESNTVSISEDTTLKVSLSLKKYELKFNISDENDLFVEGADIVINSDTTIYTDANGYAIIELYADLYSYTINKSGYISLNDTITVTTSGAIVNKAIEPIVYTIDFTITNSEGTPISGALVEFKYDQDTSNSLGKLSFELAEGLQQYTISHDYFNTYNGNIILLKDSSLNPSLDSVLYQVNFKITNENGFSIADAEVSINNENTLSTDNQGEVVFDLTRRTHSYEVSKLNYLNNTGQLNIVSDTLISLQIVTDGVDINLTTSNVFTIYPNPANEYIEIDGVMKGEIVIYSISGAIVKQYNINSSENRINVSHLKAGVYYLKIRSEQIEETKVIIIE